MKIPATKPGAARITVQPPRGGVVTAVLREQLSESEAWQIVQAIRPTFAEHVAQYNTKKYWPEVYERVRREFLNAATMSPGALKDALLWKYGHLGKSAIPLDHEKLISQLQRGWPAAVAGLPNVSDDAFIALDHSFGGKTRFVTIAFLLHLLHPTNVPIIDQHNFRAVNALMAGVRPAWRAKMHPSRYADIVLVAAFMKAVLGAWTLRAPESAPSDRDLDKFLMMYGKSIKTPSNKRFQPRLNRRR